MSIFSKIAAGEIPSYKCAEDDKFYAFLDINPVALGHTLVIPRQEVDYVFDLDDDDKIKAVVLRVNSPGGSAFGSEQIWQAVGKVKARKPVVVSMGDYAASGGYYISCIADRIFAEPTTLTGSIGIFGMFPNVKGLLDRIEFRERKNQ